MHRNRHARFHHMERSNPFPETEHEVFALPLDATPRAPLLLPRELVETPCSPDDTSPRCEKPASSPTLAIILGSAIPIVCALFVLVWLHRRSTKRLRQEEMNDKTKSMDFGMEFPSAGGKALQKSNGEKSSTNQRQLSMDLNNPYLLPAGLRGSRDSLQSLSKTLNAGTDRYGVRPGTGHSNVVPPLSPGFASQRNYAPSHHSNLAPSRGRDSSIYEQSIRNGEDSPSGSTTSMSAELLKGAQNMAMSSPPRSASPASPLVRSDRIPELGNPTLPSPAITRPLSLGLPSTLKSGISVGKSNPKGRDSYIEKDTEDGRQIGVQPTSRMNEQHNKDRGETIPRDNGPSITISEPPRPSSPQKVDVRPVSDGSQYAEDVNPSIEFRFSTASPEPVEQPAPRKLTGRDTLAPGVYDNRRLSMGFRPLPPEGSKDESAEERAMRIRSFYKEYFDDSAPDARPTSQVAETGYYDITDDYMPSHQDDATPVYDPGSDRFVIPGAKPFAEPPTRRAMTPPPRLPQQLQEHRMPSQSGRFMPPAPRSFSSASGRLPPHIHGPQNPRRPVLPPQPLHILPTPAALREDAFASPIMFAPPPRIQDVVAGTRPDSPSFQPGTRAYTPTVPAHIPLQSTFSELSALSAPHTLRKSGTYTALDFAPPRKFKMDDGLSDSGSIRSNKTGISQLQAIRSGAYRVSRLPQDVVPLKDAMTAHLKPTMDLSQRY